MRCIDCALFDTCNDRRRIDRQVKAIGFPCKEFIWGTGGFIFMINGKYIDTMIVEEKVCEVNRIMGPDKRTDTVHFRKIKLRIGDVARYIFVAEIK